MNEIFTEVKSVTIDMPTKHIAYMVEDYIGGRIKKIWVANFDNFVCIKMTIETESGERIFAKFVKLESIESIEVLYV